MVVLGCRLILLYLIHAFLMLVQSFPERIYWVNVFFIRYFKRFRDLLKQVVTFDAVQNILSDQRSKNYEQMAPKVSHGNLHRTPDRALHFTQEIFNRRFIIIISHNTREFTHI